MNSPPPSEVLQQLHGKIVDCVRFANYTIQLSIDPSNGLTFTAPFRFGATTSIRQSTTNDFPVESSDLMRIVGSSILNASCETDGTLILQFSNDDVLIVDALKMYEAYTLLIHGTEYYV
jgi:Family of unknown function (DUF6188)